MALKWQFRIASLLVLTYGFTLNGNTSPPFQFAQSEALATGVSRCTAEAVTFEELADALDPTHQRSPTPSTEVIAMFTGADMVASQSVTAEVQRTVDKISACSGPGTEMQLYGFYTEGYLRRNPEAVCLRIQTMRGTVGTPAPRGKASSGPAFELTLEELKVLDDSRVVGLFGSIVDGAKQPADLIIVFARVSNSWRIDEAVQGFSNLNSDDQSAAAPTQLRPYDCPGLDPTPTP